MVLKKVSALTMSLVALLALCAPLAFGQSVDSTATDSTIAPLDSDATMEMDATMGVDASQTAGQSINDVNYANVLLAVNNIEADIEKFNALSDLSAERVHVISVRTLIPPDGSTADIDQALATSASQLDQLQELVEDNDALENAIDAKNVDEDKVVGLDVLQDGNVVVFYLDPEAGQ